MRELGVRCAGVKTDGDTQIDEALAAYCRLRVFDASSARAISYPVELSCPALLVSSFPSNHRLFFSLDACSPRSKSYALFSLALSSTQSIHVRQVPPSKIDRLIIALAFFNQAGPAFLSFASKLALLGGAFTQIITAILKHHGPYHLYPFNTPLRHPSPVLHSRYTLATFKRCSFYTIGKDTTTPSTLGTIPA